MTIPEWDSLVALYLADANGTAFPLVELGDVPLDGTWEVLCAGVDSGIRWVTVDRRDGLFVAADGDDTTLIVARPIGSDNAD